MRSGKVVAMLVVAAVAMSAAPAFAKNGQNTAAIIGGLAGLAIGAAAVSAASSDYQHQNQYVPPPPPPPPPPRYKAPFSPAAGVVCYPKQRSCFNDDGDFLPTWTSRVF